CELVSPGTDALTCTSLATAVKVSVVDAYPFASEFTTHELRVPVPLTMTKLTGVPFTGVPFDRTRAVSMTFTVAPSAICAVCGASAKSKEDELAASVVCTCFAGL